MCFCGVTVRAQTNLQYWQGQSIYQVITDRFYNGDTSNDNADGNYNPSGNTGTSVHGGDFKGLEKKLDYIKALGATAIWISPIVLNANGEFHGYAGRDFYHVDPHWGSLADLQHMVQTAHAKGLLVIDDIVCNHGGDLINSSDSGYSSFLAPPAGYTLKYRSASKTYPTPFDLNPNNPSLSNLFHNNGTISNFNDTNQVVLGELSGLDDFRTESLYVRLAMTQIYQYWVTNIGFDGFRIDTVKHVDMGFWQSWCPPVHATAASNNLPNFFMFGEIEDGSESKVGSYTGTKAGGAFALDSSLDYPLYFTVNSALSTASGNTKQIEDHYNAIAANYDPAAQMRLVTFLDNHDQPRFLSSGNANNNTARLNLALAFLYTSRGIPSLYYGTEQDFNGTTDPNNREDMFHGKFEQGPSVGDNFNMSHPRFQLVAMLNNFRRLYPAMSLGTHVNLWNTPGGPGLFSYARRLGTQEVFVVFNTASSSQTLTNRSTIYAPGTVLVNLLNTNETITITSPTAQTPMVTVPGTTAKVFIAQSQMLPLDPVVISNSPVHDASNVNAHASIILQFSKPMDTNSVQNAFSITPAVSGSFSWSATHDTVTFTPAGLGYPAFSNMFVQITNSATDAVTSNAFFAPYQLSFASGAAGTADNLAPTISLASPTNNSLVSGNVSITGTAADNVAVQKVEISLDGGTWTQAVGTISWSYLLNTSNLVNGPHILSARATDTSGNISTNSSVTVRFFNIPGSYLQRISGGNPTNVTDCSSNIWLADVTYSTGAFGYIGGTNGNVVSNIAGICAPAQSLYQREHYSTGAGGFSYQFDCPPGVYETTLLETETYWSAANSRTFNVFIQGQQVLTNFDIFATAGGADIAVTQTFTNNVTNSQLVVQFTPVIDNARVSGIQARKIADVSSGNDGIPDWWRLGYFGHATGSAADNSRATDDADGDGASNLNEFLAGTNPLNSASVFRITQASVNGTDVQISWSSVTNRIYQLQRRNGLDVSSSWNNLGSATNGTGSVITQTDVAGVSNTAADYRVQGRSVSF